MMPETIQPETLRDLILKVLNQYSGFHYIDGVQPFSIIFDEKKYYIYIKNLSSAYFKDRPDTTRAQLPIRDEFEQIKLSDIPFIFLGYDSNNDVLVCWNFHVVKNRLNEKKSVSFYSRQYFQDEVVTDEFLRKELKNADRPVLFKRKNLIEFFQNINTFFPINEDKDSIELVKETKKTITENPFVENGKIFKIIEQDLIDKLKPTIASGRQFEAAKQAEAFYNNKYPKMTLKDWFNLLKRINDEPILYNEDSNEAYLSEPLSENSNEHKAQITPRPYAVIPSKRKTHILRVTYPNGNIIENRIVSQTLFEVVVGAGLERVRNLGIMLNGCNLVSNTVIPTYKRSQKPAGDGLYIMTCCDTNTKQKIIQQISDALDLNLVIEKISI
mgnify:FL=1